jgi:Tol biopolymer transport system component
VAEIVLLDTETAMETVLVAAKDRFDTPAISPDGRQVAYTAGDGIYVVSVEGSEPQRVVETCVVRRQPDGYATWDDWSPAPSWSPDGQWLVYHRCIRSCPEWCEDIEDYSIFKVNVETSAETLLVKGGLNPYWRLDPVTAGKPQNY